MHFLNFRDSGQLLADFGAAHGVFGLDEDEGGQGNAQGLGVQTHFVALDDPFLFQLFDPLQHAGWSHTDLAGQFGVGDLAV